MLLPMIHLNAAQQGFGLLSYQSFDAVSFGLL